MSDLNTSGALDDISNNLHELNSYISGVRNLAVTLASHDDDEIGITMGEFASILGVAIRSTESVKSEIDSLYDKLIEEKKAAKNEGVVQ